MSLRACRPRTLGARLAALALVAACGAACGGCGDTLQDKPIPHNLLEQLIVAPFPVYWLGGTFNGLAVTAATRDPSGAFTVQYGDCLRGGQASCIAPLRVVTSPDNSFLPGSSAPHTLARLRAVTALLAHRGATIELPTGGVVVGIYANGARLARAAARGMVPINAVGAPEAALPAPLPNTGYGATPLPSQLPSPVRSLG